MEKFKMGYCTVNGEHVLVKNGEVFTVFGKDLPESNVVSFKTPLWIDERMLKETNNLLSQKYPNASVNYLLSETLGSNNLNAQEQCFVDAVNQLVVNRVNGYTKQARRFNGVEIYCYAKESVQFFSPYFSKIYVCIKIKKTLICYRVEICKREVVFTLLGKGYGETDVKICCLETTLLDQVNNYSATKYANDNTVLIQDFLKLNLPKDRGERLLYWATKGHIKFDNNKVVIVEASKKNSQGVEYVDCLVTFYQTTHRGTEKNVLSFVVVNNEIIIGDELFTNDDRNAYNFVAEKLKL